MTIAMKDITVNLPANDNDFASINDDNGNVNIDSLTKPEIRRLFAVLTTAIHAGLDSLVVKDENIDGTYEAHFDITSEADIVSIQGRIVHDTDYETGDTFDDISSYWHDFEIESIPLSLWNEIHVAIQDENSDHSI